MFDKLFGKSQLDAPDTVPLTNKQPKRMRALEGSDSAESAAELLTTPTALMQLTLAEARVVVSYMQPKIILAGTTFIREGDRRDTGYMLLLIEGEVTIENIVVSRTSPVTITVLGPGSLIGEMGLVDGEPRSASCTATSSVRCAVLTREALEELIHDEAEIGAKLMMAVALRIAERQRETADKLKLYTQLVSAMQQEIDKLMPT